MARPDRQVCPICGHDDEVELQHVVDEWIFTCGSTRHVPYEWRPKTDPGLMTYRNGLGQELGVYDDLLECLSAGITEYGVIEYRFSQRAPKSYAYLVERYGHRAIKPKSYTASAFLGGALGQLWREELLDGLWVPATGYWSYNGKVGAYSRPGTPDDADLLSWERFAADTLGVDPRDWPPLGFSYAGQSA